MCNYDRHESHFRLTSVINLTSNENLKPDCTRQVLTRIGKRMSVLVTFNQFYHSEDQVISPSPYYIIIIFFHLSDVKPFAKVPAI